MIFERTMIFFYRHHIPSASGWLYVDIFMHVGALAEGSLDASMGMIKFRLTSARLLY